MRSSLHLLTLAALVLANQAQAISFTPFGPALEGGSLNGQSLLVGAGGEVFELDAFVHVAGADLNGASAGTSAQLSLDPLPAAFDLVSSASLSADATDLLLHYEITNVGTSDVLGVTWMSFLDAEIDEATNTFFNEYATVVGAPAPGQGFEVDEPGYVFGDVYDHLLDGTLDGTNAVPIGAPDDVSIALSFDVAALEPGQALAVDILISEDGDALGPLAIVQQDDDPSSPTAITYSGAARILDAEAAPVPEPRAAVLFALGSFVLARASRRR